MVILPKNELTSLESIFEGEGIEDLKSFLCPARKTSLILVESNV